MSAIVAGTVLIGACLAYAAAFNFEAAGGRWSLQCARLLVVVGAVLMGLALMREVAFFKIFVVALAATILVVRRPLVETLLAPAAALCGLLGSLVAVQEPSVWTSVSLASALACAALAVAGWTVHRFERARAMLVAEAAVAPRPARSRPRPLVALSARSAS